MMDIPVVPGDMATFNGATVRVSAFADGQMTAVDVHGNTVVGDPAAFVPLPKPDPSLTATAKRIADLQEQLFALQKKLQSVERERDAAEARAAALLRPPAPKVIIETCIARNVGEGGLAHYLNDGWGILHMQFVPCKDLSEDGWELDKLNVVLQREVPIPPPQPEARAAVAVPAPEVRTVVGTIVPEPPPAPEPVGVYASILRQSDLPIAERLALMNDHIIGQVVANVAPPPAPVYRPLSALGGQS
jgi:hypothetical protein